MERQKERKKKGERREEEGKIKRAEEIKKGKERIRKNYKKKNARGGTKMVSRGSRKLFGQHPTLWLWKLDCHSKGGERGAVYLTTGCTQTCTLKEKC